MSLPNSYSILPPRRRIPYLFSVFLVILTLTQAPAQTSATSPNPASSGFVQVINQVGQQGLNLFRAILFVFLMIYAVLLGLAVAFGQAGSREIVSFILGSIIAAGAQLIAALYLAILT